MKKLPFIEKKDFALYDKRSKSSGNHFCPICETSVTSQDCDEDGYTNCCNEPAISSDVFLEAAKFISINEFLEEIPQEGSRDCYIYRDRDKPWHDFVVMPDLEEKIEIHLKNESIDSIIRIINNSFTSLNKRIEKENKSNKPKKKYVKEACFR